MISNPSRRYHIMLDRVDQLRSARDLSLIKTEEKVAQAAMITLNHNVT